MMAPWTGKQIQSTLDKLSADNVEQTTEKLVSLLESRSQVQKLALLVSKRVQLAYNPTFHQPYDERRRQIADTLVAYLLADFEKCRKSIKGVPTREGLSGRNLLKADLLSSGLFARQRIAPVATSLYNSSALSTSDVKTIIMACLDKMYVSDADKIGDALLLLEYTARELDREDSLSLDTIFDLTKEQLDQVPDRSSERKKCGNRVIPSLNDRYWELIQKRKESWRESPYGTFNNPSNETSPTAKESEPSETKVVSDIVVDEPLPFEDSSSWPKDFTPVGLKARKSSRKGSDEKTRGPITNTNDKAGTVAAAVIAPLAFSLDKEEDAQISYGQAIGDPDQLQQSKASVFNPSVSFDDEDDSMWFQLPVHELDSPIKVKFDADTRLGDARRIARLLAASVAADTTFQGDQSVDSSSSSPSSSLSASTATATAPPIHFLSDGCIGQTLHFSTNNKQVFVQYPHHMTLLQARKVGDRLAGAVQSYSSAL